MKSENKFSDKTVREYERADITMSSEKDERIRRVISASSFGEFADGWILCDTDFKVLSVSDVKRGTAWSVKVGYNILPFLSESFAERIISTDDWTRGFVHGNRENICAVAVWARVDDTRCLVFLPDVCSAIRAGAGADGIMKTICDRVGDFITSTVRESLTRTGDTPRLRALNMMLIRRLRKKFTTVMLKPDLTGKASAATRTAAVPVESLLTFVVESVRAGLAGTGCRVENLSGRGGEHFCTCGDRFMMGFIMTLMFSALMLSGGRRVFVGMDIKDNDGGGIGGVMSVESDFSCLEKPEDGKAGLTALASELMNECIFPAAPELMICAETAKSLGWETDSYVRGDRFGITVRFKGLTGAGLAYVPEIFREISHDADRLAMEFASEMSEYRTTDQDPWMMFSVLRKVCRAPETEKTDSTRTMSRETTREREREREYDAPAPESRYDEYPEYGEPARSPSPYRYK